MPPRIPFVRSPGPARVGRKAGLLSGAVVLLLVTFAAADDPAPPATNPGPKTSSQQTPPAKPPVPAPQDNPLDRELLDDLTNDLLEGLDEPPPAANQPGGEPTAPPAGEDVELGAVDPLTRIARQMKTAEARIADRRAADQTQQLQQQIVSDLSALIQQVQQQSQKRRQQSAQNRSRPGQSDGEGMQSPSQPARDSTDRIGKTAGSDSDAKELAGLIKEVWGHLPPRVRERMQNVAVEQFMPKYEQLIEDYYRRLADDLN